MPKQSTSEKIIALLDKEDIDERKVVYHTIKAYMTAKLTEHTKSLEEAQNKFIQIKEKL